MNQRLLLAGTMLFLAAALHGQTKPSVPVTEALNYEKMEFADVGHPALEGKVKAGDGRVEITAGGADVWGKRDEFAFAWVSRQGDFDLVTRVEGLTAAHLYTKAGIMARESLDEGSRHVYFQVFPDNRPRNKNNGGCEFQYREQAGADMKAIYPPSAEGTPPFPVSYPDTWIRFRRSGNEFTGLHSTDGQTWKAFASFTLDLPETLHVGLAVTSHDVAASATAVFSETAFMKQSTNP